MLELFFGLLLAVLLWATPHNHKRRDELLEGWHQEGLQEFRAFKVSASLERFAFDGATAAILKTERYCLRRGGEVFRDEFTVVFFAKNPAGEFFMFRKTGNGKPFFKHVGKRMAINVLHLEEPRE